MSLLLVVHLLVAGAPAEGAPAQPPSGASRTPERSGLVLPQLDDPAWYGWQPMIADGAAGLLFGSSIAISYLSPGSNPVALFLLQVASGGVYLLGGPILHLARGRWGQALIDLAVRAIAPLTGTFVGLLLCLKCNTPAWVGFLTGITTAVALDYFSLSWNRPAPDPSEDRLSLRWAPFAGAVRGAPVAGVCGAF